MTVDFQKLIEKHSIPRMPKPENLGNPFFFEKDYNKIIPTIKELEEFPLLDLGFLTRTKKGFPEFAIFTLRHEACHLGVKLHFNRESWRNEVNIDANFSGVFRKYFRHTFHKLAKLAMQQSIIGCNSCVVTINSEFNGLVPETIRSLIRENEDKFKEIVIIAEADNWTLEKKVTYFPPNPDPLIVGIREKHAYLIGTFDVTKVEQYVSKEFTYGKKTN